MEFTLENGILQENVKMVEMPVEYGGHSRKWNFAGKCKLTNTSQENIILDKITHFNKQMTFSRNIIQFS